MATKEGSVLATLAKRLLGFRSAASCCAAPTASAAQESKECGTQAVQTITPAPHTHDGSCCAPSCCSTSALAGSGTKSAR
jgi:hypothetical protein